MSSDRASTSENGAAASSRHKFLSKIKPNIRSIAMKAESNLIHKRVGEVFEKAIPPDSSLVLLRDIACGGRQRVPLFCSREKSRASEYCNVDLLLLKDGKIKVIVEIEESDVKPTQICGKLLTSALSKFYIHPSNADKPVEMAENVLFIQTVDTSKLVRDKTAKYAQRKALEESIRQILPIKGSRITGYRLLPTTDDLTELEKYLRQIFAGL